ITQTDFLQSDTTEIFLSNCDPSQVGTTQTLLTNSNGCDSLVITQTDLLPSDTTEIFLSNCDPNQVGTTQTLLTNSNGCDSLVITQTNLLLSDTTEIFLSDCDPNQVGTTQTLLTNTNGCDSLIITQIDLLLSDTTEIFLNTCDSNQIGIIQNLLVNANGCDSLVITQTEFWPNNTCAISALLLGDSLDCEASTGSLWVNVVAGAAPFSYTWEGDGLNPLGSGTIGGLDDWISIDDLAAGNYSMTITSALGSEVVLTSQIVEQAGFEISLLVNSDYQGFGVSCEAAADGEAEVLIEGGVAPFELLWSNGQEGVIADNLTAGWHYISVIDDAGCEQQDSIWLSEPPPLVAQIELSDPSCFEVSDGQIQLIGAEDGRWPYTYAINEQPFQDSPDFGGLGAGVYRIRIRDAIGCEAEELVVINAPAPLLAVLGQDTTVQLGDSLAIQLVSNTAIEQLASIDWSAIECANCPEIMVQPLVATTYAVQITDERGCQAEDALFVGVQKDRLVFFPNIFTPNNDGFNDHYTLHLGPSAVRVERFQVYSRWGEVVYQISDLPADERIITWDGTFRGQAMNTGVFVYWAIIEFVDGENVLYQGDLLLQR
ncbi:MAG: gliding motility-associated C-terminal domain-containing protein, partial [Bacteroidota bacterium]